MKYNAELYSKTGHKRLALFFHSFNGGGQEIVFLNLAKAFVEIGYEVDIVVAVKKGPLLEKAQNTGARIVDLGVKRFRYALPKIIKYIRKNKPFAILTGLTHVNSITILARILSGINTRIIVSEDNPMSISISNSSYWWSRLLPIFIRRSYPLADAIICVSSGVADDLVRLGKLDKGKISVIYNPIDIADVIQKANFPLSDSYFNENLAVVLAVGRLDKQKDFSTLIYAFAELRKKLSARLLILGEGSERLSLEKLIKELNLEQDVRMPGFVNNPYVYMRHAKVLVLSSRWEGFGNVLVEAMALGTPVVATDCPSGPAEILEGGKLGPLVPVGNYKRLAEAIYHIIESPPSPELLRQRALEFDLKRIASQYLRIIDPQFTVDENKA